MLHVYCDDYTWLIATTPEDVYDVESETCGLRAGEDYGMDEIVWEQLDDDAPITVHHDGGISVTLKAKEWCAVKGRGFLCSSEY